MSLPAYGPATFDPFAGVRGGAVLRRGSHPCDERITVGGAVGMSEASDLIASSF